MSLRRRHLSPLTQFLTIAILALFVGVAILAWPVIGKNVADPAGRPQPAPSEEARGTFRPTKEQWAGFKIEPVGLVSFRPEQVTEGSIAIDDDLTTPVFSQHSGRVIKLIAKLGDRVEAGAPLFEIQATEFVQAQNDLITALANLQTARSQLAQAQTNERRAHDLYLAQGGALKDWQQAQTDLITSQNTVRADEIALAAVRNRLRILGKSDKEIASLEAQPTQKLDPVTIVTAPIGGIITQRQIGSVSTSTACRGARPVRSTRSAICLPSG